ncbi:GAF domain-containing protein [Candidatus Poribacteria bacterium]|nr:GAF domain-containing protein [Candidatus Poribacteria bacterium]
MDNKDINNTLQTLLDITTNLSASLDVDSILYKINTFASNLVFSEVSSILLFDDERLYLYFKAASGEKAPILRKISVTDGIAWLVTQKGEPVIVNDTDSDPRFTGTVDDMTGFKTKSILCVPVVLEGEIIGALEAINKRNGAKFTQTDLKLFSSLANQVAIVIKNAKIIENQQNFITNAIEIFVKAIDSVGVIMGIMSPGHCWRVAEIATAIGQNVEMSRKSSDDLYYGAVLHEIGILGYQGNEYVQLEFSYDDNYGLGGGMKFHPVIGANMVKDITLLSGTGLIIRHHHENYDGTGYPDGLKGDEIPLGARIVAIAEMYENTLLNSKLTELMETREMALQKVKKSAGTILDPLLVDIFLRGLRPSYQRG